MTALREPARGGATAAPEEADARGSRTVGEATSTADDGFATIDGARHVRIGRVDRLDPFFMSVVGDSDVWCFVGSNGPFTAGRGTADRALFPYQTVDRILRTSRSSGALTVLHVERDGRSTTWEPWQDGPVPAGIERTLYKRVDGTGVIFDEVHRELGLRFRTSLATCERFGLVRHATLEELDGRPVTVRVLDGFHQLLPAGIGEDLWSRYSYLAAAYMRHERLAGLPLAVVALNATISDRPEPSEALRVAAAWSLGHRDPTILLCDRQAGAFRRGASVHAEDEVRGEVGAFLVADTVPLAGHASHAWVTVADTGLDAAAVIELRSLVADPGRARAALDAAVASSRAGIRHRVAGADGLERGEDEAATAAHESSVLFNLMRGGSFDLGHLVPADDLRAYVRSRNADVAARHAGWLAGLPDGRTIDEVVADAEAQGDPQLDRIVGTYLPLSFSRRHGDPSRPWNRFTIRLRDRDGTIVRGYEGNWRDIFQNWEALARSFPAFLPQLVAVFLDASTADGYNPYRITRDGIDWEVEDPRDPWSHIGYWGDHQVEYLQRLLDALERHRPGMLTGLLDTRRFAYAEVPYRIRGFDAILADPRRTIDFDHDRHAALRAARRELGADGSLRRGPDGEVTLVTLAEKLLVPLLVKLTNLVPGSGIWLNTQRPEWNDANNALAGWGLSMVTMNAIARYLGTLGTLMAGDGTVALGGGVARLLREVTAILATLELPMDDARRFAAMERLGRAGEAHRAGIGAADTAASVAVPLAEVRALLAEAGRIVAATIRGAREADGLYRSYDLLRVTDGRASVAGLGPMLEGQVAVLGSGLLDDAAAIALLDALRASPLYRPDLGTYLLYPDREVASYLARNAIAGEPPIRDPRLVTRDPEGTWRFDADLATLADVERRLDAIGVPAADREPIRVLWRTTFGHDGFTGRSARFFMFEGLGSVYWHMIGKLALAVAVAHRRAADPAAAAALAERYHAIRDGLGFRMDAATFGAIPTDPYSHSPRHRGAQQPGMTGQVKEQILARHEELGLTVDGGRLRIAPRLLARDELLTRPATFVVLDASGHDTAVEVPAGGIGFTVCQVPVVCRETDAERIAVTWADGSVTELDGDRLDEDASDAILGRRGTVRRLDVSVARGRLWVPGADRASSRAPSPA